MHILSIHQAFASFDEPGGTRHYEFARLLATRGHKVTVIASPVSYITGEKALSSVAHYEETFHTQGAGDGGEVRILRATVYSAHHKSFFHRVIAFLSFMLSSFFIGLKVKNVDVIWGTSPPIFQLAIRVGFDTCPTESEWAYTADCSGSSELFNR